jgi:hypothetical protein
VTGRSREAPRCTRSPKPNASAPGDGQRRVLDGPFAESKEVIARYFLIEAPDIDTAVAIAARCPNAEFGSVEVREIVPMG